jgi:hypothetical protein
MPERHLFFVGMLKCQSCQSMFSAVRIKDKTVVMRNMDGAPLYRGKCPVCNAEGDWCGDL